MGPVSRGTSRVGAERAHRLTASLGATPHILSPTHCGLVDIVTYWHVTFKWLAVLRRSVGRKPVQNNLDRHRTRDLCNCRQWGCTCLGVQMTETLCHLRATV